jgi:hypothetical protein
MLLAQSVPTAAQMLVAGSLGISASVSADLDVHGFSLLANFHGF